EGTFGTGRGAGRVDRATATDPRTGLPRVASSAVVGLLTEATADVLRWTGAEPGSPLWGAAETLYGRPGWDGPGGLRPLAEWAEVPRAVRYWIEDEIEAGRTAVRAVHRAATLAHDQ